MFSRSDHPDKGVKRSTHLLCKEATGKKYEAALKWGIPVETPEWLINQIQCKTKENEPLNRSLSCSINDGRMIDLHLILSISFRLDINCKSSHLFHFLYSSKQQQIYK